MKKLLLILAVTMSLVAFQRVTFPISTGSSGTDPTALKKTAKATSADITAGTADRWVDAKLLKDTSGKHTTIKSVDFKYSLGKYLVGLTWVDENGTSHTADDTTPIAIPRTEVVDDLNTSDSTKALSAKQGKALNDGKASLTYVNTELAKKINTSDIQTTVRATAAAEDTKVPSEKAVRALFESLQVTGDFIGAADTFATLPTTSGAGKTAANGDWAMLNTVDGTNKKGIYVYDGAGYVFSVEISGDVLSHTDAQLQDITDVTEGTIKGGKALYDREQALKGDTNELVTGTSDVAKMYDAKTLATGV